MSGRSTSRSENTVVSQKGQQRQKRKPKHGRLISFYRRKEVHAAAFQAISADRGHNSIALEREIVFSRNASLNLRIVRRGETTVSH